MGSTERHAGRVDVVRIEWSMGAGVVGWVGGLGGCSQGGVRWKPVMRRTLRGLAGRDGAVISVATDDESQDPEEEGEDMVELHCGDC